MRFRSAIVLAGIIFFLSSMLPGGDPVSVVKSFVNAVNSRDFKKAEKLVTDGYKYHFEEMKRKPAALHRKTVVEKYTLREQNDSTAIVDLLLRPAKDIPETSLQAHCKKTAGKWLIDVIF